MLFNSFDFIWLFPIVFIIYYSVVFLFSRKRADCKIENIVLLLLSYSLYIKFNPVYVLLLLGVTLVTYTSAILIENSENRRKQHLLTAGICLGILPLVIFKYYDFIHENLNALLGYIGVNVGLPGLNWALPIGISFFTFQAIGYLIDVYYQKIQAERSRLDYMLFVSFFPQIASGPISKAQDPLPQIKQRKNFDYAKAVEGLKWLLWGMFLGVVLADRLGSSISSFGIESLNGGMTLFFSVLYSFQIYGDFAGYSFMAMGVGKIMGFDLINNFRRPYFSQSITEFWHRWHISLSIWLRDYIYIPLGGSRCSKPRNYFNIFVTFLISGIWHGANWTFILWGTLHGVFQIIEKASGLNKVTSSGIVKVVRIFVNFVILTLLWIFFRNNTIHDAWIQIEKIFCDYNYNLSLSWQVFFFIIVALSIVIGKDFVDEFNIKRLQFFSSKCVFVRWAAYLICMILILLMGVFDAAQFIYVNF